MITFLILSCGTNACYHVAKTLKEKYPKQFRIIGADVNLQWMIPTSTYIDTYYQCPYSSSSEFYPFILNVCRNENVDYLLPSFDADQFLFYEENPDLLELGVRSFGISELLKDIYSSKEKTNHYLAGIGVPIPRMYSLSEIEEGKDYFVKPKHGVGSVGARIAKGIEIKNVKDDSLLIQEICFGPEITLECFNYNEKIYSVARVRLGSKAGVCTKTRIFQDEELAMVASHFAQSIHLPHIFNLQFMKNSSGRYVVTDVNLRTAGGMSLSYAAGWDEVSALAKIMLGEESVTSTVDVKIYEQYVVRAYTDIVTKIPSKRIGFDFDGTLLDSRFRHEHLMMDILRSKGFDLNAKGLVEYKSCGNNNLAWLKEHGIDEDLATAINAEWISKIETATYLSDDVLYPHVIEMLERLSHQYSLFLVTARSNREAVLVQLQKLGIKQYFDDICVVPSGNNSSTLKSMYIKENKIEIFIGDTEIDMKAAAMAGCKFEACANGFRSPLFWSQYNVSFFNEKNY